MRHAILALSLGVTMLVGCRATVEDSGVPTTQIVSPDGLAQRSAAVDAARGRLADVVGQLPGSNVDEHRRIMAEALAEAGTVLRDLHPGQPTGAFNVQLRTVERSRDHLMNGGVNLPVDAVVEEGLLATHRALASLLANGYNRADGAAADVDALQATLHELDNTLPGAPQRWVASRGMREVNDAVRKMAELLKQDAAAAVATEPATE